MANFSAPPTKAAFVEILRPITRNDRRQYSMTLLYPANSPELQYLFGIALELAQETYPGCDLSIFNYINSPFKNCRDTNEKRRVQGKAPLSGFDDDKVAVKLVKLESTDPEKIHFFTPPVIYDEFMQPVPGADDKYVYSGMVAAATFGATYYPQSGDKRAGVGFWLRDVMKMADGEKFVSQSDSTELFAQYAKPQQPGVVVPSANNPFQPQPEVQTATPQSIQSQQPGVIVPSANNPFQPQPEMQTAPQLIQSQQPGVAGFGASPAPQHQQGPLASPPAGGVANPGSALPHQQPVQTDPPFPIPDLPVSEPNTQLPPVAAAFGQQPPSTPPQQPPVATAFGQPPSTNPYSQPVQPNTGFTNDYGDDDTPF